MDAVAPVVPWSGAKDAAPFQRSLSCGLTLWLAVGIGILAMTKTALANQ